MSKTAPVLPEDISPVRSVAAVSLGWGAFYFLQSLSTTLVARLLPAHFPMPQGNVSPEDFQPLEYMPSTTGLIIAIALHVFNAAAGGILTARIARFGILGHGAALASLLGLFGALAMGDLQGFPGWFALATLFGAPIGVMLGTLLGARAFRRAPPKRITSEVFTKE